MSRAQALHLSRAVRDIPSSDSIKPLGGDPNSGRAEPTASGDRPMRAFRLGVNRTLLVAVLVTIALSVASSVSAGPKKVFMAPDDHTDYFWSATDVEYRQLFIQMLDFYIAQAEATAGERPEHQSRFSADGSLWLWEYEKNKTPGEFQRLVDRIRSGHISAPKNPLVITYGGVPAEAVL